ncbi:sugar phosphate isomerase/epimerase [soil metagenome]
MKSAVTVSLVPEARGGPFVFWDDLPAACRTAKQLGFEAIELFAPGPDAVPVKELKSLLDGEGLLLAAVGTGAGWVKHRLTLTSPDTSVRAKAIDFVKSMIDYGANFSAPAIIGSMQGRWGEGVEKAMAMGWLTNSLQVLGIHAAKNMLLYEPLNRYETNLFNTMSDGVKLIDSANQSNVKLLADLFHMNIEETSVPVAIRKAEGYIGHVHLADSNRWAAGFGHTDFAPIIAALIASEYEGYLSAEVLPLPDSNAAAAKTIESIRQLLR